MEKTVSAADANRHFSALIRSVRDGETFIVTSHGKPVARISPATGEERVSERARELLLARLQSQPIVAAGRWTRESLYEDDR
jgi:prevent-host-death family protein